jgi:hypothetical protein
MVIAKNVGSGARGAKSPKGTKSCAPNNGSGTEAQAKNGPAIELTVFQRTGGPLSKVISLAADGSVRADAHKMSQGRAWRVVIGDVEELADLINGLKPTQAITLGALRKDLPDEVKVTVKERLNGEAGVIARDKKHIVYRKGKPALALIDFDRAGMPKETRRAHRRRFLGDIVCRVAGIA